jgi:hypothetical protein
MHHMQPYVFPGSGNFSYIYCLWAHMNSNQINEEAPKIFIFYMYIPNFTVIIIFFKDTVEEGSNIFSG